MAVYGYDFYLLSKYGSRILIDYGVDPFVGEAVDYTHVRLTWSEPTGSWGGFRVLRNRNGAAINEVDGDVIYSVTTTPTAGSVVDTVGGPGWYYYTVYIYNSVSLVWERAAITHALVPTNHESSRILLENTPEFFRVVRDDTAGYSPANYTANPALYLNSLSTAPNLHLLKFYDVLGWGLDTLWTQVDTIRWCYDTSKVHLNRLALLADQFGSDIERSVPAQTSRNLVRNLALLYRKRGTVSGLEEMAELATGWNVSVSIGPNLMLNEDQANFVNPQVDDWDGSYRYVVGDVVRFNARFFTALIASFGAAQSPPATGTNTWWDQVVNVEENVTTVRNLRPDGTPDTLNVSTWQAIALAPSFPMVLTTSTHIGRGVTDPTDAAILNTNSLGIKNTTAGTRDVLVRSVPFLSTDLVNLDREFTVSSVIPVPIAVTPYVAGALYQRGNVVLYRGVGYEAIRDNSTLPSTTDWKKLGIDSRGRMALSLYAHGPFSGTSAPLAVSPYLAAFDGSGDLVYEVTFTSATSLNVNYDSFNLPASLVATKAFDVGGKTWETIGGTWGQDWNVVGFYYPNSAAQCYAVSNSTIADATVALTFTSIGTRSQGIMFRYTNATNYWRAGKTQLVKVVAGVETNVGAAYSTFVAKDRMKVVLSGSSITVQKNGTTMVAATDAFNSTATRHGMVVEV